MGVATARSEDPDSVGARTQARQKALQLRIGEEEKRRDAEIRAEERRIILERYDPLDKTIANGELRVDMIGHDVVSWVVGVPAATFVRSPTVTGSRLTGAQMPCPGVFAFDLLSASLCARIWAETEHSLSVAKERSLPQP